jgi:hypothetical protein
VGYPVDMPVMLTYFEGSELKPVRPDYPDYDHLVNHVAVQLEGNDLHLFQTPIVLTLQGEFEDEEFNEVSPFQHRRQEGSDLAGSTDEDSQERDEEDTEEEMGYDESAQEITLEELLRTEDFDRDEDEEDGDDSWEEQDRDGGIDGWAAEDSCDDNKEGQDGLHPADSDADPLLAFLNNPASRSRTRPGAVASTHVKPTPDHSTPAASAPSTEHAGFKLHRPEQPDLSNITPEALVTAEDTVGLQRAHRRADRIIEYATDMRLMGSFHYKKRNFHLVRLLEVGFVPMCTVVCCCLHTVMEGVSHWRVGTLPCLQRCHRTALTLHSLHCRLICFCPCSLLQPIFVMGRRLADIKGHFFALLDERDTEQVIPTAACWTYSSVTLWH